MTPEPVAERLEQTRQAVEEACRCLLCPSPASLDRCYSALNTATDQLNGGAPSLTAARGDARALAEAWRLRSTIRRAGALLENANRYYSGWRRIRSAMTDGYSPTGELPSPVNPGRVHLEA